MKTFMEMTNQNNKPSFSFKYKGNPDLTWEKSSTFNTGLEFDIAGVLDGEIEYFHKSYGYVVHEAGISFIGICFLSGER